MLVAPFFQIHFEQMQSVRSMFEDSSQNTQPAPASPVKRTGSSKWDKPKVEPPPPVNRVQEQDSVEEIEADQEPLHVEEQERDVVRESQEREEVSAFARLSTALAFS